MTGVERRPARVAGDELRSSFLRLAERFDPGAGAGLTATYVVEVPDREPVSIHVRGGRCLVAPGPTPDPDATLTASASTWLDLVAGRVDGIAAFVAGRLRVAGDLSLAARFETLFAPGPQAVRRVAHRRTRVGRERIDALVSGDGPAVVLLHGLGANKLSFLPTLDGLSDRFQVHALDLPGFGDSSKPLPTGRRYSMTWLADVVHGYLVANGLEGAHVVGNSMGGRVAVELALRHPGAVRSVTGLGPAVAFDEYRHLGPLLRLSRPQWLGLAPLPVGPGLVERFVRDLFHDPDAVPAANHRAAAHHVLATLRDPAARMALLACARQLAAERSRGRRTYWSRLARLAVPSYWVFGERDRLVAPRYAERVRRTLPTARVERWPDVGHVPQFERPEATNRSLVAWLGSVADHRTAGGEPPRALSPATARSTPQAS